MTTCMSSSSLARRPVGLWQERRQLQRHWARPTVSRPSHSLRRPVCASASPSAEEEIIAALPPVPYSRHAWNWKGHNISWATAGCGKPIVLVHGFGASLEHYKRNFPVLAANYKVYALDLLGFGRSAKPVLPYTMEQWEELVVDFLGEFVEQPAVIVGNSLGSLTSLMVSASAPDRIAGTVLLNCAGGMNNKAISDDLRIKLAMPIFLLIDYLLAQPRIARYLFDRFRTKENIRQVLMNVYTGNPAAVDQELVDMIYSASCDEGALEAFVSIMSGPPGPRPEELIPKISTPMLVLWGTKDPFTPSDGPVGRYFQRLAEQRPGIVDFVHLPGVGHCPHDETPDEVHGHLLPWLEKHHA